MFIAQTNKARKNGKNTKNGKIEKKRRHFNDYVSTKDARKMKKRRHSTITYNCNEKIKNGKN
jgi:hypothetical protein